MDLVYQSEKRNSQHRNMLGLIPNAEVNPSNADSSVDVTGNATSHISDFFNNANHLSFDTVKCEPDYFGEQQRLYDQTAEFHHHHHHHHQEVLLPRFGDPVDFLVSMGSQNQEISSVVATIPSNNRLSGDVSTSSFPGGHFKSGGGNDCTPKIRKIDGEETGAKETELVSTAKEGAGDQSRDSVLPNSSIPGERGDKTHHNSHGKRSQRTPVIQPYVTHASNQVEIWV